MPVVLKSSCTKTHKPRVHLSLSSTLTFSLSLFRAHFLSLSLSPTHTYTHYEYGHQLDLQNQPKLTFLERLNAGGLCLGFIGLNLICVHCCAVCMGYKVASL